MGLVSTAGGSAAVGSPHSTITELFMGKSGNSLCFLSTAEERKGEEKTSVKTAGRQIGVMSDYQR